MKPDVIYIAKIIVFAFLHMVVLLHLKKSSGLNCMNFHVDNLGKVMQMKGGGIGNSS